MYRQLYEVWRNEAEATTIQPLTKGFYPKIREYLKGLEEELGLLDVKSLKFRLKKQELSQASRLARLLVEMRLKKMASSCQIQGESVYPENLTDEEKALHSQIVETSKSLKSFAADILETEILKPSPKVKPHRATVVRFTKETPAIMGADMKSYGPFKAGDVASIPTENIEGLIKHDIAKKVEIP